MATSREGLLPFGGRWDAVQRRTDDRERGPADCGEAALSDEQLARAIAAQDERALAEVVARYEARLAEFIRWSLEDASDLTEDVLQEVFLQVHRSACRFAGQSSFKTWLYALARNVCRHELRKLKHQPAWSADTAETLLEVAATDPGPLDAMSRDETRRAVRAAVESLPPSHRVVMLLRDWEDLSYSEIAEVLDVPVGTVRSRLHNARTMLTLKLERFRR